MQDTSQITNYDSIVSGGDYFVETKLNLDGVDYGEDKLISLSTSSALFGNVPSVGNCYSAEIDVEMLNPNNVIIPPMAMLKPFVRLFSEEHSQFVVGGATLYLQSGSVDDETAEFGDDSDVSGTIAILTNHSVVTYSGWLQKGVFYIDTRMITKDSYGADVLTIHGYDAMLKTEAFYPEDDPSNYPMVDTDVVDLIAEAIGVDVDDRTYDIMVDSYSINLPATYTMREVLSNIAAMYAGNFCITPEGKLRLVGLTDIGVETNYLIDQAGEAITFGGDRIIV